MVFFFNKEKNVCKQNELIEDYLFLPHTNELFENLSQFVFDEKSAGEVFSQLQTIIAERAKSSNSKESEDDAVTEKHTQIVCFVLDDYDIKEKAFSKYIPEAPVEGEEYVNSLGLTFIFIKSEKGMLPKYCGSIVELDNPRRISNRYNLLSHETLSKLAGGNDSSTTTDDIIEYTSFTNNIFLGMVHQLCLMMNLVLHLGDLVRFIIQELLKMEKCHLSLLCLSCIKIYIMLLQKRYKVMDYLI